MKRYDDSSMDRLFAHAWGDSIHFGRFDTGVTEIGQATLGTKRRMARESGLREGDSVLEVGSGWGATARFLAREIGCHVTATNYSWRQADTARTLCADLIASGSIRFAMADFHNLPFQDAYFDVHWSQECLVHATDKARVFAEALRVLKPGGRIVFSDQTTQPDRLSQADRDRIVARHGSTDLWDRADFEDGLRQAGFGNVRSQEWTPHMARHFTELCRRIDTDRPRLEAEIDPDTLRDNYAMWQWGAELAADGRIGWALFIGEKPQ